MKTNQFLTGAARSCRTLLCLLIPICITLSVSGQLNINPVKSKVSTLAKRVQQIYTSQIGIREKGANSGPAVEKYLSYVDLPKGNPWCAAFVCWALGEAGVRNPRSGWSPDLFPVSKTIYDRVDNGKLKRVESGEWRMENVALQGLNALTTLNSQLSTFNSPGTGDVFALYFPEKGRIAHVGFIDQWDGTWLITVEGNTNVSGGREGDGVYRKRRLVRSIYKVARYIKN